MFEPLKLLFELRTFGNVEGMCIENVESMLLFNLPPVDNVLVTKPRGPLLSREVSTTPVEWIVGGVMRLPLNPDMRLLALSLALALLNPDIRIGPIPAFCCSDILMLGSMPLNTRKATISLSMRPSSRSVNSLREE